ncbi:unnamed protein product [Macrosiphum euphorbiae]|uniref:Uncharacterized protein n=1 Tax=Macrosiphum euphorbiae TaxID=13131 RepID=A0AAV0XNY6_9HEMI|nr:unnamed protein product [Macrosiphum euphorbiae]
MPIDYYKFFSIVLEPNPEYPTRGVQKTFDTWRRYIHFTSAVMDMDFESMLGPATFLPGVHCENVRRWMASKYTLKMNFNGEESVLCHLHVANDFQSNIDVYLPGNTQSAVEFYCEETCRIHLNGKILIP